MKAGKIKAISVTPQLPSWNSESAGGRFVRSLLNVVAADADLELMAPRGGANLRAAEGGVPFSFQFVTSVQSMNNADRLARILNRKSEPIGRRLVELSAEPGWGRNIFKSPNLSHDVEQADIIDLQWEEQAMLIPAIRKINKSARIICVFHDVLSQRFERNANNSGSRFRRAYWKIAALRAKRLEKFIMNEADAVIVLSEKDGGLLPIGNAELVVVRPEPMTFSSSSLERKPDQCTLLFVGYLARFENEDAISWFVEEILPRIRLAFPQVAVKVAGRGIRPHVQEMADNSDIELLDFVEDLEEIYSTCSCMIVPLRHGAGVKFKVVDAISNAVPIVTTSVGAEGIFEGSEQLDTFDDAVAFANEVIRKLRDQETAEREAQSLAHSFATKQGGNETDARIRKAYFGY